MKRRDFLAGVAAMFGPLAFPFRNLFSRGVVRNQDVVLYGVCDGGTYENCRISGAASVVRNCKFVNCQGEVRGVKLVERCDFSGSYISIAGHGQTMRRCVLRAPDSREAHTLTFA